jgi:hypothetical protein
MECILERTSVDRMTDMYVVRPLPVVPGRFLAFTRREWEKMYPNLVLNRGEKKNFCLTLTETGV